MPEALTLSLVSQVHHTTHLGYEKMEELIRKYFLIPRLSSLCRMEPQNCSACSQVNAAPDISRNPWEYSQRIPFPLNV